VLCHLKECDFVGLDAVTFMCKSVTTSYQQGSCSSNILNSYLGGAPFEYWPEYVLSRLVVSFRRDKFRDGTSSRPNHS
jgi:hypothetical protein